MDVLPVWAISPDWANGVLERLEWLTDVLQSPVGAEQRRKLRLTPRRSLEFPYVLSDQERAWLDVFGRGLTASDWYMPLWHDIQRVTAPVLASGTGEVFFDTTLHEFYAGGPAILYHDFLEYEICEVTSVAANKITLTVPPVIDWPTGTILMPVMRGKLTQLPNATRLSSRAGSGTAIFTGALANPFAESMGSLPTWKEFPVLTLAPDESSPLTNALQSLQFILDNPRGLTHITDLAGQAFNVDQYRWFIVGRAKHIAHRKLLYALAGRFTPLWVPTFFDDIRLTAPVNRAATTIEFNRIGYYESGQINKLGRKDIMFTLADGTFKFASVVASARIDSKRESMTIDPAPGADLGLPFIKQVSFMSLRRQDADMIEISHASDAAGVTQVVSIFRDAPDIRDPGYDAFNPVGAQGGAIFSNFDQTVTTGGAGTGNIFVRTKHPHKRGKWYFEGTYLKSLGFGFGSGFGICTGDATQSDASTKGVLAYQYGPGFGITALGSVIFNSALAAMPQRFCIAVDMDNKLFWCANNEDGNFNADAGANPSTGTGGISFSSLGDVDMYPYAFGNPSLDNTWIINLGSSGFFKAVPAGFRRGWSAQRLMGVGDNP